METFSALLAPCAGYSPVSGELPSQKAVARSSAVFLNLSLKNVGVNNRVAGDLRRHLAHYDATVMTEASRLALHLNLIFDWLWFQNSYFGTC